MTARLRAVGRLLVAALVVALAGVVTGARTPSAGAQTAAPSLTLVGQSPWIALNGDFLLRFHGANVPAGATVALTVHDGLQSRTAFDDSVSGTNLPPTRDRRAYPYDALQVDPTTGDRILATPSAGLAGGVYPLEVDLRSAAEESLAHFVTHIVVTPVNADGTLVVGQALNVAWVWPLTAEPAFLAGGPNPATLADLRADGRLGRQARQLAADTDVPVTLAPSAETLAAWSLFANRPELADGPPSLRSTTARNQILAGPFVPLDLPSLDRSGLGDVVDSELARGVSTLETFFGVHLDPSTALPGPLDGASLRVMQNASARQLVLEGDALTPVNEKYTPAHPYKMETVPGDDSTAVTVLATDTGLERFLAGDEPPALRAAHLLAGLAVVAGEQPSIPRGIAIANPAQWDADDTFVSQVLGGLRNNPLLKPTTVAGLLDAVPVATDGDEPDAAPVHRQLVPVTPGPAPVTAAQYRQGVANRDKVAETVGATDARTQAADRALASSVAAAWANPAGRVKARDLLRSIPSSLGGYLSQVQVQPQSTVTITSSKAEIPISFRNTGDNPIRVHLKLESDKLLFPEGAELDVDLPRQHNTTVRVAVETRGSGTSPVTLTVTTASGLPIGTPTRIEVRSTFVSGVGVFLTVGAIVFLALWWGWDIQRRRKKRAREQHPTYRLAPPSGQPA